MRSKNFRIQLFLLFVAALSTTSLAAPGDLDPTFGNAGKVVLSQGSAYNQFRGVRRFSNGKLLVFGGDNYIIAKRLLSNGDIDTDFGYYGSLSWYAIPPNPLVSGHAMDAVILSDGSIVVVGKAKENPSDTIYKPAIWRFDSSGVLDASFGTGGRILLSTGAGCVYEVEERQSKLYLLYTRPEGTYLSRRFSSGGADFTFGNLGMVQISTGQTSEYSTDLKVSASDGKIYVVNGGLKRYATDGSVDTTFGFLGIVSKPKYDVCVGMEDPIGFSMNSVTFGTHGKLIVGGVAYKDTGTGVYLYLSGATRYTGSGVVDATFNNGEIVCAGALVGPVMTTTALQADDKVLFAAGVATNSIERINSDGSIDTGYAMVSDPFPTDVTIQPADGKALILYNREIHRRLP